MLGMLHIRFVQLIQATQYKLKPRAISNLFMCYYLISYALFVTHFCKARIMFSFPDAVGKCPMKFKVLADVAERPEILVEDDNFDAILRAFTRQGAAQMDRSFTDQVRISLANIIGCI